MLSELKQALAPHNLMLTAAMAPGIETANAAYDLPAMVNLLDQFHVRNNKSHLISHSYIFKNVIINR